ncbi:reverse transcriptase [Caerostris darwini]|uniref:Reverse transcriptase n=1 Tax=Caerostris darwini TaxID=1538125 RepID=A0AAV4PR98_9ARAC|nr:reverse transcriptase [Caerostris darwini]
MGSICLPFKNEIPLSSNINLALRGHKKMCKRAANEKYIDDYISIFKEWERLEIFEEIQDEGVNEFGHYLPHRPIIKENYKTSKIRSVFDVSAKEESTTFKYSVD